MYANIVKPVEIPTEGGRTRTLKNGYVYWISKSSWDREKKRTVDDRVCIGKAVPEKDGWIYPNDKFLKLFNSEENLSQESFSKKLKTLARFLRDP